MPITLFSRNTMLLLPDPLELKSGSQPFPLQG
jgi:hypothetical protein